MGLYDRDYIRDRPADRRERRAFPRVGPGRFTGLEALAYVAASVAVGLVVVWLTQGLAG